MTDVTRVMLAARRLPGETSRSFTYRIDEMKGLCHAAGAEIVAVALQETTELDAARLFGRGKTEEMAQMVDANDVALTIVGSDLTPGQINNLEGILNCRVIDRTQLILDIFALRAQSKAGRMQVEIAQLEYLLPRLTGRGVAMSRLGGGIGTRGPGETKLEVDRRRLRDRIARLRHALKDVARIRQVQRAKRSVSVPVVALVGYTNAGKTSLLNAWTSLRGTGNAPNGNNRLFDTLDPVARRVKAGTSGELVLLDTVGFVQDLPHLLVDAFRSTLEEVLAADVIVLVVDATAEVEAHLETTHRVLAEIGVTDTPILTFFNKMDAASERPAPDTRAAKSIYGSVGQRVALDDLLAAVDAAVAMDAVRFTVDGPADSVTFWSAIAKSARVLDSHEVPDGRVRLTVQLDRRDALRLRDAGAWEMQSDNP